MAPRRRHRRLENPIWGNHARLGEGKWRFLQESVFLDTPTDPGELTLAVRDIFKKLGGTPKGVIGWGIAGRVAWPQRRLALAPRLSPCWHGVSLVELSQGWVGL